jgi:hypothetical protein
VIDKCFVIGHPPALPEHPRENLTREISSNSRQKRVMRWFVAALISEAINGRPVSPKQRARRGDMPDCPLKIKIESYLSQNLQGLVTMIVLPIANAHQPIRS